MLQLYMTPEGKEACDIVKRFVNERLIRIMEDIIMDEGVFTMEDDLNPDDWEKPIEELVDLSALSEDMDFAKNVSSRYLPEGFPLDQANYEFFGLYRLLKAKGEYKPPLPMEYILYHLIQQEIAEVDLVNELMEEGAFDEIEDYFDGIDPDDGDFDEEAITVEHIPEPDRSIVLNAIREKCEPDDDPEEFLSWYEDLRMYEEVCFEDIDCLLLDDMTEDDIYQTGFAKQMGIAERQDIQTVNISQKNGNPIRMDVRIAPWDLEQ